MKEIIEFIIKNITTHPDDVVITEETIDGVINFQVTVNQEDVGRVIGKEGKIIKSVRAIMRVIAIQRNVRVRINVLSEGEVASSMAEEVQAKEEEQETATTVTETPETDESLTVEL